MLALENSCIVFCALDVFDEEIELLDACWEGKWLISLVLSLALSPLSTKWSSLPSILVVLQNQ